MSRGTQIHITPAVLRWAIEQSGLSVSELASRFGDDFDVNALRAWQSGESKPLLSQFRRLADVLKRPTATFFLPEPPKRSLPAVQFRHPPGINRNTLNPVERRYLREAARLQRTLSWLLQELEIGAPKIKLTSINANPEITATRLREQFPITEKAQIEWRNSSVALQSWRSVVESLGVFVFLIPLGKDSARGFSVWDEHAPLIAINTWWNTEARIFTLFHEYAHLLTRTSSACYGVTGRILSNTGDTTERWCEHFSSAFLLPWDGLRKFLQDEYVWKSGTDISDLDVVRAIARRYKVSLRASALRLINKKAATWDLYSEIPNWSDEKKPGGGGKGRQRAKIKEDQFGTRTASFFLAGIEKDLLTRADALSYLDVTDTDLDAFARKVTA